MWIFVLAMNVHNTRVSMYRVSFIESFVYPLQYLIVVSISMIYVIQILRAEFHYSVYLHNIQTFYQIRTLKGSLNHAYSSNVPAYGQNELPQRLSK